MSSHSKSKLNTDDDDDDDDDDDEDEGGGYDADGKPFETTNNKKTKKKKKQKQKQKQSATGALVQRVLSGKACSCKKHRVTLNVLQDIESLRVREVAEVETFKDQNASDQEIGRRLLFLFQFDLLQGVQGAVLEAKGQRDFAKPHYVSRPAKIAGWLFLIVLNLGMLCYIVLFALTQERHRQQAWFQSFLLWLGMEVLLVSTMMVVMTHIVLPSFIRKDVARVKERLVQDISAFQSNLRRKGNQDQKSKEEEEAAVFGVADDEVDGGDTGTEADVEHGKGKPFNAASTLFISHRVAQHFPQLLESQIILEYLTPWPRQSYKHQHDTAKSYDKTMASIFKSFSMLFFYFLAYYMQVPASLQDMIVQALSTTFVGYLAFLQIQLFGISPLLVAVPIVALVVCLHFFIFTNYAEARMKLARLNEASRTVWAPPAQGDGGAEGMGVGEEEGEHIALQGMRAISHDDVDWVPVDRDEYISLSRSIDYAGHEQVEGRAEFEAGIDQLYPAEDEVIGSHSHAYEHGAQQQHLQQHHIYLTSTDPAAGGAGSGGRGGADSGSLSHRLHELDALVPVHEHIASSASASSRYSYRPYGGNHSSDRGHRLGSVSSISTIGDSIQPSSREATLLKSSALIGELDRTITAIDDDIAEQQRRRMEVDRTAVGPSFTQPGEPGAAGLAEAEHGDGRGIGEDDDGGDDMLLHLRPRGGVHQHIPLADEQGLDQINLSEDFGATEAASGGGADGGADGGAGGGAGGSVGLSAHQRRQQQLHSQPSYAFGAHRELDPKQVLVKSAAASSADDSKILEFSAPSGHEQAGTVIGAGGGKGGPAPPPDAVESALETAKRNAAAAKVVAASGVTSTSSSSVSSLSMASYLTSRATRSRISPRKHHHSKDKQEDKDGVTGGVAGGVTGGGGGNVRLSTSHAPQRITVGKSYDDRDDDDDDDDHDGGAVATGRNGKVADDDEEEAVVLPAGLKASSAAKAPTIAFTSSSAVPLQPHHHHHHHHRNLASAAEAVTAMVAPPPHSKPAAYSVRRYSVAEGNADDADDTQATLMYQSEEVVEDNNSDRLYAGGFGGFGKISDMFRPSTAAVEGASASVAGASAAGAPSDSKDEATDDAHQQGRGKGLRGSLQLDDMEDQSGR